MLSGRGGRNGFFGEDGDTRTRHGEKAASHVVDELLTLAELDADLAGLSEFAEQRRVPMEHADFAFGRPRDDHLGLAGPNLLLNGYELDM